MTEGIRKEKNLPERIARTIILNEQLFIQDLKIFANTSVVGSQGSQAGGSSGGPSGVGNYLRKDGDAMDGVFATRPSIATIADGEIDISKVTAINYTSKAFVIAEGGSDVDELNFIFGGVVGTTITGAEFPGQWLIIQPIAGQTITINNDVSGFGDPIATPKQNIRTPDGNPVILKNEQSVLLNFDSTSGQWSFLGAVGTSVLGDICFPEKDSGDQSGALTIFFNRNRSCRMRVIGNLTITFDTSEMIFGKIYFLTVEVLQDPTGQRIVTYADAPFENNLTPKVFKAANRYTSTRFYAYKLDAGSAVRIFAFDEFQEFSQEFFDGYIQARLDTDQTSNLTASKHVEFDLKIATDNTILVTTGSGQSAGIFTNFEVGHLYQCEVALAVESLAQADSEFSFQFYNVTKAQFFGSQARALTVSNAEFDSSLVIAKGFFVADAISDTVEVRIKSMFGVNSIKAGDQSAEQMSYIIIKDCGVAGIDNLPGNIIPAPTPTGPEVVGPLKGYMIGHMQFNSPITSHFSLGGGTPGTSIATSTVPAMGNGKFKTLRTHIDVDSGDDLDLATYVNGISSGLIFTPINGVGNHITDLLDRAFVKDDLISLSLGRTGSSGNINFANWLEIEYNSNDFWFYGPRAIGGQGTDQFSPLIGNAVHITPGVNGTVRLDHQRAIGRSGTIQDFVYYGTAPSGTGDTIISIEVNGFVVFSTPSLAVSAGPNIFRFDGIGIVVNANDLINIKMNGRVGTTMEGICGCRFVSD